MPETKGKKERATRKIVGRMGYKALFKPDGDGGQCPGLG